MEDKLLIDGLFARDERSVARLEEKYSGYCYTVAYAVVRCREDAQECVGDAMLGAWDSIPPNRPENLGAYLGRIARNSALNMLKARRSKKRGEKNVALALDELSECIPSAENTEQQADTVLLREAVNGFLDSLERERRIVFIQRYWYMLGISEIAAERGMTEGAVKMSLKRTRDCLKIFSKRRALRYEKEDLLKAVGGADDRFIAEAAPKK